MRAYDPFDDSKRQLDLFRRWLAGRGRNVLAGIGAVLVLVGLVSSYYQIERDEVGVVLRFGKHVAPNAEPGPHFRLPFGIDRVIKVPVERQLKMEFGYRTVASEVQSSFTRDHAASTESKMLTADRNVAIVEWIVQYRIANPEKYLFGFRDIDATLRLMTESSMRAVVGDYTVDELITGGREEIETQAKARLEALNARYDTGISIQQLKLQDVNVPDAVKPALREVEEAKQEMARAINIAEAERNQKLPEARGVAKEMLASAEGYHVARINEAAGDAARFKALQAEYRKAPQVTRTRLYMETLSKVLPRAKQKVVVDSNAKSVLPLLNLQTGAKP
jgi:modulator of FtsH protease HflK